MKQGDKYYDGPVLPDGRTYEELERDESEEWERIKDMKWDPSMLNE